MENGVKDCSKCLIPHQRDNYGYLAGRFQEIAGEIARHEQEPRAESAEERADRECLATEMHTGYG